MQERISWDEYFMLQAVALASRSTCNRLSVGAVLVRDKRLIASGYNGSVEGDAHCIDEGDLIVDGHCIRTIHAEQNALLQCAKYGVPVDGAEVYVTDFPCANCTKMLLQAGIKKINYLRNYRNDDFAMHLINLKKVELNQVHFSPNSQDAVDLAKFTN
ncbi:ComE operon protein 2 [Periweissella fabaria]|uniref:ComE operon protein 2 n=1 Tax=Periweissella fabaria TaxID=546157 RepID=A0ABM8Z4W8_9LACO|nr:ComE operon protein 2 [Periweissella fabaria]MCM0596707.1 ComE operon protein 2 [Periweissella fabaria]CAH0416367.1 tRNA-specific adenosine deaminase [Periweissella fabaria]